MISVELFWRIYRVRFLLKQLNILLTRIHYLLLKCTKWRIIMMPFTFCGYPNHEPVFLWYMLLLLAFGSHKKRSICFVFLDFSTLSNLTFWTFFILFLVLGYPLMFVSCFTYSNHELVCFISLERTHLHCCGVFYMQQLKSNPWDGKIQI